MSFGDLLSEDIIVVDQYIAPRIHAQRKAVLRHPSPGRFQDKTLSYPTILRSSRSEVCAVSRDLIEHIRNGNGEDQAEMDQEICEEVLHGSDCAICLTGRLSTQGQTAVYLDPFQPCGQALSVIF